MHNARFGKSAVAAAVLSVLLFVAAVPPAHAGERERCQQRIEKAEARLDEAIRKHGERSPQANDRRRDLNAERERCWREQHGWWDGHAHQWHTDRDWDHDAH
ncbi:MAG TPA: hypothetical protein VN810_12670 [Terriglobales bacterium]|nr:hypothetical protein [Terriglobales bacterium]